MRIAVTDANIFIDLLYVDLHPLITQLGLEIYTTRHVIDELDEEQVQSLPKVNIYQFKDDEFVKLSAYKIKRGLSDADHSVLFIAEKLAAIVLSGDDLVRKTCIERKLEVHGVLWIMDECVRCNHLTTAEAHKKLTTLMSYNKRLPKRDCEERLARWETIAE
jgi:predicted nucleic acid-binding protein